MTTKVRYDQIRVAENTDDQKLPAEILTALVASLTQEDLQEFVLSQLKRVIHGANPGNWQDDFFAQGIEDLSEVSTSMQANCTPAEQVGDVVYITGAAQVGLIQVARADVGDVTKMPGMGIITSKVSDTSCIVKRSGIIWGTGFLPGKLYFVGIDGRPAPFSPIFRQAFPKSLVQPIGIAVGQHRLMLSISFMMTQVTAGP